MSRVEFLVSGSADEPYRVVIEKSGSNLNAFCTCPAGSNGQVCKHKMRLINGNPEGLVQGESFLSAVTDWVAGTEVESVLREIALAEEKCLSAKREFDAAKKKLAVVLRSKF